MGKPSQQTGGGSRGSSATGHVEPPSLLSSFAGIIETGMLNVFHSVADKRDDSAPRASSLRRAPGGHHVVLGGERFSARTEDKDDLVSNAVPGKLSTLRSESESDMPGLERLERTTCPASSEDEVGNCWVTYFTLLAYAAVRYCATVLSVGVEACSMYV